MQQFDPEKIGYVEIITETNSEVPNDQRPNAQNVFPNSDSCVIVLRGVVSQEAQCRLALVATD